MKYGGRRAAANSFCAITYELFNQLLSNLKILLLMIEWSSSSILTMFTLTFIYVVVYDILENDYKYAVIENKIEVKLYKIDNIHSNRSGVKVFRLWKMALFIVSVQFIMKHLTSAFKILMCCYLRKKETH